jgi:hypothetical protein
MTLRVGVSYLVVSFASFVIAGCGSGAGGHTFTYVFSTGPLSQIGGGSYMTVVSPVSIPNDALTKNGAKLLSHLRGPQLCSYQRTVHGGHGRSAILNGKTLTVTINGTPPADLNMYCEVLKKNKTLPVVAIGRG